MANRQQRRHPAPERLHPEVVPMVLQRLGTPEYAADLTVPELKEITARNDEQAFVQAQADHFARLLTIVAGERARFIRDLCNGKGLSPTDEFNCDLERGVILRTARQAPLEAVEAEAVPEPANGEAPDHALEQTPALEEE